MQQPLKIDDRNFSETPTATDSSGSEGSTPPESPMSLEDYFGMPRKEEDQKVIINFSLPPIQKDYFNKQDARVTIANPQFNTDTESSRSTVYDFIRNCQIDGATLSVPEDSKQIGKFFKEKLNTPAGAATLDGFIKFIQEGNAVGAKLCQGIDQLVIEMGKKGIQINSNENIFHLSWNMQQNTWSAKTAIPFNIFSIEKADMGAATGHYLAEILYKENSHGKPIITLTAQFSALQGLEKLDLSEAELRPSMKRALDQYKRPSTLAASLSGFLASSASLTTTAVTPLTLSLDSGQSLRLSASK